MDVFYEEYSQFSQISPFDLAYLQHDERLKPFIAYEPFLENFNEAIEHRRDYQVDRSLLVKVLEDQYETLNLQAPATLKELLSNNTFTVTTAHQPTLFTGPLFHIYKIASTINLATQLRNHFPHSQFVPVFIVSGEDHDWAEINHLYVFGKKYEWDRTAKGPVGRLNTDGLDELITQLLGLLENAPHRDELRSIFDRALQQATNYSEFHTILVHGIFEKHDLIILNPDDARLKKAFIPFFEKELLEQFSYDAVTDVQRQIEEAGFRAQAFCRPINIFYMEDGIRERIERTENKFTRVESQISYSQEEIIQLLHEHPERFSPNVILRPLFQEYTLPNLAYIGGGGELAYWLDRKKQFEIAGIPYPMLIRRNSILLIEASTKNQLDKMQLPYVELAKDFQQVIRHYLQLQRQSDLSLDKELSLLSEAYQQLAEKAELIDPTLAKAILAEEHKQTKAFEQLGSRLVRAEKQQQETQLKKIERLREKLYPGNGLQERHDNFLPYYAKYGQAWIDKLVQLSDPFVKKFMIVELPQ